MKSLNHNTERTILDAFKIEDRIIHTVVDIISTVVYDNQYCIIDVSPVALIVLENKRKYVINLNCTEIDEIELIKLVDL